MPTHQEKDRDADNRTAPAVEAGAPPGGLSTETPEAEAAPGGDPATPAESTADPGITEELKNRIIGQLRLVYDPEIPVNIYELGLIYDIVPGGEGKIHIRMTLTSPNCPEAEAIPPEVEYRVEQLDEVRDATVELVWEPPWTPDRMTEAAKLELGML